MEKWDVYDKNGELTGKIKTRNDIWNDGEYHLGAHLWIINKEGHVLIQKRAAVKRIHPNVWCIAGGSVLSGETSKQGCVREVNEEFGIRVNESDIVFLKRAFRKSNFDDEYAIIYDFPLEHITIQPEEVSEVKWASIEEIKKLYIEGKFMLSSLKDLENVVMFIDSHIN